VVTIEEVGSDVVATGSGRLDLSGLSTFISQTGPAVLNVSVGFAMVRSRV
jgi:hypothetical protein